jgi:hypothetical protein
LARDGARESGDVDRFLGGDLKGPSALALVPFYVAPSGLCLLRSYPGFQRMSPKATIASPLGYRMPARWASRKRSSISNATRTLRTVYKSDRRSRQITGLPDVRDDPAATYRRLSPITCQRSTLSNSARWASRRFSRNLGPLTRACAGLWRWSRFMSPFQGSIFCGPTQGSSECRQRRQSLPPWAIEFRPVGPPGSVRDHPQRSRRA